MTVTTLRHRDRDFVLPLARGSAQRQLFVRTERWMKAALALLTLGLLAGCAHAVSPETIDGPVKLGEVAYVGGPRVRPDRVIEDSRCPVDAQCVWAGRVVLEATVFGGTWSKQVELTLGTPISVADGNLTLVSVDPERSQAQVPQQQQLRFRFAFEGGLYASMLAS